MLDYQKLIAASRIEARARQDGLANLPLTDSATLSDAENDVCRLVQTEVQSFEAKLIKSCRLMREEAQRAEGLSADVESIGALYNEVTQTVVDVDQALVALRARKVDVEGDLRYFRSQHQVPLVPDIEMNLHAALNFGLGLMVLEAAFNVSFFMHAMKGGILEAATVAFTLAMANYAIGFVTGFGGFRFLWYKNRYAFIPAFLLTCAGLVSGACLNLFVAHYRDALKTKNGISPQIVDVFDKVSNVVFPGSLQSLCLLCVGLFVFGIAIYKGIHTFGEYPYYGKLYKKNFETSEEIGEEIKFVNGLLLDIQQEVREVASREVGKLQECRAVLSDKKDKLASAELNFKNQVSELYRIANAVCGLYRSKNIEVRRSSPPEYFRSAVLFSVNSAMQLEYVDAVAAVDRVILKLNGEQERIRERESECLAYIERNLITQTPAAIEAGVRDGKRALPASGAT